MSDVLGGFEHTVLLAIVRLGSEAYSVPIVRVLEKETGRHVAPAAVYVTLRRLEKKGLLKSYMAPPEDGKGGRERRVFRIQPEALDVLRATRRDLHRLWEGVEALDV